ncbi:MAG: Ig-like domain-containing protein [Gemmatimonadota bacterium]
MLHLRCRPATLLLLTVGACTRAAPAGGAADATPVADTAPASVTPAAARPSVAWRGDTVLLAGLTGDFHATTTPEFRGGREQFEMTLRAEGGLHVGIARYGAGRPGPGRYPLAPLNRADPGGRFYATLTTGGGRGDAAGDTVRAYVSVAGELVVTESSGERVAGSFRFTGAEYSARWRPAGRRGSGSPDRVEPGAPTVEVRGTFTAGRFRPEEMVACAGTGGPSVVVEVRDAEGRPAAIGTTIVIQEGEFRDSVPGTRAWDELRVGAGERRPGTYEVRLYKPGYQPAVLRGVRAPPTGNPRCNYAEPSDVRRVTLRPLPDAPPVRSVVVLPPSAGLGAPGIEVPMTAVVDAAPGVSRAVRWSSSDTTVATVTPDGIVRSRCRRTPGEATITATSVAEPRVRGQGRVSVSAATPMPGLHPPEAAAKLEACLESLRRAGRP